MSHKYSFKGGFKLLGEKGQHIVASELTHLHDMDIFEPLYAIKLPIQDISEVLFYLRFLTDKSGVRIKGWTCTNRRKSGHK